MNRDTKVVTTALEAMRTNAPPGVLANVLAATGIADRYTTIAGPSGQLYVSWSERGISSVAPAADDAEFEEIHSQRVGRRTVRDDMVPQRLRKGIVRALETGKLGTLPVDLDGLTPFQREVLNTTATIPAGEIRSYGWVAREMGRSTAVRAVGSALNRNPVPVLIPCHRVGRSDGSIGEYAFGRQMKRDLLRAEGLDPDQLDEAASRGVRLVGSDSTHIFCVPTCRNAKRITEPHLVEFRSESIARDGGYRPCKVCRPAAA